MLSIHRAFVNFRFCLPWNCSTVMWTASAYLREGCPKSLGNHSSSTV